MELTTEEINFLIQVLDKIQVQGIGNSLALGSIFQKLNAELGKRAPVNIEQVTSAQE